MVDSSEPEIFQRNSKSLHEALSLCDIKVTHLASNSGLPHQRNIGRDWALNNLNEVVDYTFFMDDDIIVPPDFFRLSQQALGQYSVEIIGAWDSALTVRKRRSLRILLGFEPRDDSQGHSFSTGGYATVGQITGEPHLVEWAPGHSFGVSRKVLASTSFNSEIRMIGEDIEFQIAAQAKILMSPNIFIMHHPSSSGRVSSHDSTYLNDLLRWSLATGNHFGILSRHVFFTTLLEVAAVFFRMSPFQALPIFTGHLRFLRLSRKQRFSASEENGFSRILGLTLEEFLVP